MNYTKEELIGKTFYTDITIKGGYPIVGIDKSGKNYIINNLVGGTFTYAIGSILRYINDGEWYLEELHYEIY